MGKFLTRAFAVIGLLVTLLAVGIGLVGWHMMKHPSTPKEPDNVVLELDFTHPIVEQAHASPFSFAQVVGDDEETPLLDILSAINHAKEDPHVKGIIARFGDTPSMVHVQEIREALKAFKAKGKYTYAFAANYGDFGQGNRDYYLASMFDNIWLQPVGTVSMSGIVMEAPFGKTALANIGVSADFFQREEYKSFMETFARDEFSPLVAVEMKAMLENLNDQQINGIAEGRKLDATKVHALADTGPFTSGEAMKGQLITHIGYFDELLKEIAEKAGDAVPTRVDVGSYLSYNANSTASKADVALIDGLGMIVDAPGGGSALSGDHVISADKLAEAFDQAADDKSVKAILFRIDSPGGSPSASETIRHALLHARLSKPVFVSMGEVAASGGYWVAMDADHIVADPGTLTGSIGVVGGKFVLGGLWDKLGVKWQRIATSDNAGIWSTNAPFSAFGRERMNALLDDTYKAFVTNVAKARNIPLEKMPDIAKGRVWTGEQAIKIGLVDELGGIDTTVLAIKKQLNLQPTDIITLRQFPPPETTADLAIKFLKNLGIEGAMVGSSLGSLQKIQVQTAPLWDSLDDSSTIMAKVPGPVLRAVH